MDAWSPPVLLVMEDQWRASAKNVFFLFLYCFCMLTKMFILLVPFVCTLQFAHIILPCKKMTLPNLITGIYFRTGCNDYVSKLRLMFNWNIVLQTEKKLCFQKLCLPVLIVSFNMFWCSWGLIFAYFSLLIQQPTFWWMAILGKGICWSFAVSLVNWTPSGDHLMVFENKHTWWCSCLQSTHLQVTNAHPWNPYENNSKLRKQELHLLAEMQKFSVIDENNFPSC